MKFQPHDMWWRHDIEMLSTFLVLYDQRSEMDSRHKGRVIRRFDMMSALLLSSCRWFESLHTHITPLQRCGSSKTSKDFLNRGSFFLRLNRSSESKVVSKILSLTHVSNQYMQEQSLWTRKVSCDHQDIRKQRGCLYTVYVVFHIYAVNSVVNTVIIVIMTTWWRHQMETFVSVTGHLCGDFTGPWWIPRTKVSDAELWCFLWSASE